MICECQIGSLTYDTLKYTIKIFAGKAQVKGEPLPPIFMALCLLSLT